MLVTIKMACKCCLLVGFNTVIFLFIFLLMVSLLDAIHLSLSIFHSAIFTLISIKSFGGEGARPSKTPAQGIFLWDISSSPLLFSLSPICHIKSFHMIVILILSSTSTPEYLEIAGGIPSTCEEAYRIQPYIALSYLTKCNCIHFSPAWAMFSAREIELKA